MPNGISTHNSVYVSQSSDYSDEQLNSDMMRIRQNFSIGNPYRNDYTDGVVRQMFTDFNRWNFTFPDYHLTRTHVKIFFTRPDLNILTSANSMSTQAAMNQLYLYVFNNQPEVFRYLTRYGSTSHDFNTLISNTPESFEISDEYIKTVEVGETFTGHRIYYGRNDIDSKGAGEFSIKYTDNYNLDVFKTHKIWVDYISRAYRGEFSPRDEYKQAKVLDYAVAAYYFLMGPDGESILFWSKFTGVFPTNTSSSTFSWDKDSMLNKPEISIKYCYSFKHDMDPAHLAEFNSLSTGGTSYVRAYEEANCGMGGTWVGPPMVIASRNPRGNTVYRLKWRPN